MKKVKSSTFKLNPIAASIVLAMASQLTTSVAYAGAGWGDNTDISGNPIRVRTFYANSPSGLHPKFDSVTGAQALDAAGKPVMSDSGTALRKFVDPMPGVYNGLDGAGIPVGIPEPWVSPDNKKTSNVFLNFTPGTNTPFENSDAYYEIAVVEYEQKMHTDLSKPTRLRGYVQIETDAIRANGLKDATGLIGSESIKATYPDGTPIYKWKKDPVTGVWAQSTEQVRFVHKPSYLGPAIVTLKGAPVRIKFTNYLPYNDATGKSVGSKDGMGGEIPLPVDEYIAGGGPLLDVNGVPTGEKFTQNRVAIHWHGGDSPWISDGTPHQWFAPAGEGAYLKGVDASHPFGLGKGVACADVPDMPESGPGSYTLYYPNNLSGRLMMYHDHTSGLTKLNAYEGEAAGYIVTDLNELSMVSKAIGSGLVDSAGKLSVLPDGSKLGSVVPLLDTLGWPLVIQDKTFVPKDIAQQDARWTTTHWGKESDLWFAHVYEPNQDPNSSDGTNPVGRWDWGPWFWPVFPAQYSLPSGAYGDVTATPESFMDTPVVNGVAYPTITVDPKTYRFRILSVANDRSQNLSLFQAVDANGKVCDATNTAPAPGALAQGQTGALALCTEVRMVPAVPTAGFPASWPTDGRIGGVPDPTTAGPDIVQIGNEAGLLPELAILKAQPTAYEYNVRSITVFNILQNSLLLMGGERADVLIDFSKYAGQTLILYNDAPSPMPAADGRVDYFTGNPDLSGAGGAYSTLPGYGPNTRTVMQIKVAELKPGATPAAPLDTAALAAALPVAYAATQPKPIVPEAVYNKPFGTAEGNNYAGIFTGSGVLPTFSWTANGIWQVSGATIVNGGTGYTKAPIVTFSPPPANTGKSNPGKTATGTATIDATGKVTAIILDTLSTGLLSEGNGYVSTPTITLTRAPGDTTGKGAVAIATVKTNKTVNIINKGIQELFDPVYGRMNATLSVELPFSTALVATTIPLAYIDKPFDYYDVIRDGETQIWKMTHNGVDSHPVHFHMVNVQVINRVGWDGTIKPPHGNELGWKETLRMNPLEDIIVAVTATRVVTPFGLPKSNRLLDPSQAAGSQFGFTQIDPTTGQAPAAPFTNELADFDNEYVWHCHILGHEENDFMRPFIFRPDVVVPDAPGSVTVTGSSVTWTDPTPLNGEDSKGWPTAGTNAGFPSPTNSSRNEIGFRVYENGTLAASLPANVTNWSGAVNSTKTYTVTAFNAAGESAAGGATTLNSGGAGTSVTSASLAAYTASGAGVSAAIAAANAATTAAQITAATPLAPTGLTQTLNTGGTITISWNAVALATNYIVTVGTTVYPLAGDPQIIAPTVTIPGLTSSAVSVIAVNNFAVPTASTQTLNADGTVTIGWTSIAGATSYSVNVEGTLYPAGAVTSLVIAGKPAATGTSIYSSVAVTASGSLQSASSASVYNGLAVVPANFSATAGAVGTGTVALTWANNKLNANGAGLTLSWVQNGVPQSLPFAANSTGASITKLTPGKSYTFTLQANSSLGNSATVSATATAQ
jgi:FtsP/CotA-like multicopper oxidase with cupredoxin domain